MQLRFYLGLCLLLAGAVSAEPAEPLTRQQGDAILKELQAIRQLLERQAGPAAAPAPAARAAAEVTIPVGDRPSLGTADAPLLMVEFTDYQCPYCRRFHEQSFPQIRREFIDTGKLRFVSMDLPLSFHSNAETAANAARCAGDQGRFWELREVMIVNAAMLSADDIRGYAQQVGLELGGFEQCMAARPYQQSIEKDSQAAQAAGISGTPSFVIGRNQAGKDLTGLKLVGAQPYAAFKIQLDKLLAQAPIAPAEVGNPMETGGVKRQGQVKADGSQ